MKGRLKIFLGSAERMLDEGKRRAERGEDVAVADEPLELAAMLRRKPEICVIREISKTWGDVDCLLAEGISVLGAIPMHDIGGVLDDFIRSADEIVVADEPGDLPELRERTLLLAAQVVEDQLQRYMEENGIMQSWGTQERILVCITPRSSARLMLESGARTAGRFHGQVLVLYVKQSGLDRAAEETIGDNLAYARKLKADVHVVEGANAMDTILLFAREQRITQVFVGHTGQSRWKLWKANPVDRLIHEAEGMDVRIFPRA